ncbi:MAG: PH domain-containing protein [Candidatus Helarchaeota archaeon]
MDSSCYQKFICPHLPLSKITDASESILLEFEPASHIVSKIFANSARIYRLIFFILFCIIELIMIWLFFPILFLEFQLNGAIPCILLLILFGSASVFLFLSYIRIKDSDFRFQQTTSYLLTNKRLYLKLAIYGYSHRPTLHPYKLQIIELPRIHSIHFYKSFWDKWYKETGSIRLKVTGPPSVVILHNLPHPQIILKTLIQACQSFSIPSPLTASHFKE